MSRRRYVLSISTWFSVKEQGMKDIEILNRASAFLVKANNSNNRSKDDFEHKPIKPMTTNDKHNSGTPREIRYSPLSASEYHIITSSHVIAPWKYPKYYTQDFIKYINETHTHYTIELRNDDGTFITQTELIPRSFHHHDKDLAILHIDDESSAMKTLKRLELQPLELLDNNIDLKTGDSLTFHGHDVRGGDGFSNETSDDRKPYPCIVQGQYFHKTLHQSFAKTAPVLTDGMCGGPVLLSSSDMTDGEKGKVCGIVEGIVPTTHPSDDLKGLAVFVDSNTITKFINDVEQGKVAPLYGGECAIDIGSDQDINKMDINKILQDDQDSSKAFFP